MDVAVQTISPSPLQHRRGANHSISGDDDGLAVVRKFHQDHSLVQITTQQRSSICSLNARYSLVERVSVTSPR